MCLHGPSVLGLKPEKNEGRRRRYKEGEVSIQGTDTGGGGIRQ